MWRESGFCPGRRRALQFYRSGFKSQSPTCQLSDLEQIPSALENLTALLCELGIINNRAHPVGLLPGLCEVRCLGNQFPA